MQILTSLLLTTLALAGSAAGQGESKPQAKPAPEPETKADPAKPEDKTPPPGDKAAAPQPGMLGVSHGTADILWTAYFVTPVKNAAPEEGRTITFIDLAGKKFRYSVTEGSFKRSEMEAVATGVDNEGRKRFGYRVSEGVWRELPEGSMGMGSKLNALVPLRHVAADHSKYPYGSMMYVEAAAGAKFEGQPPMDGWLWVADSGGAVKGNHCDLFVGAAEVYNEILHRPDIVPRYQTKIWHLPAAPEGLNPRHDDGLVAILRGKGGLPDGSVAPSKEVLRDALIAWQKTVSFIPEAEHGDPDAAVSLWFLTQAALEIQQARDAAAAAAKKAAPEKEPAKEKPAGEKGSPSKKE